MSGIEYYRAPDVKGETEKFAEAYGRVIEKFANNLNLRRNEPSDDLTVDELLKDEWDEDRLKKVAKAIAEVVEGGVDKFDYGNLERLNLVKRGFWERLMGVSQNSPIVVSRRAIFTKFMGELKKYSKNKNLKAHEVFIEILGGASPTPVL